MRCMNALVGVVRVIHSGAVEGERHSPTFFGRGTRSLTFYEAHDKIPSLQHCLCNEKWTVCFYFF